MTEKAKISTTGSMRQLAHSLIPGGAHTYAKGDDQYPQLSPSHIVRGLGCRVWDTDGNEYIEYGMGNRAVGLGHCNPAVIAAVKAQLDLGTNFTRPAAIEVAAAEKLLDLIPGADMVKFCKDGSDATSAAVKLARAYPGRDMIAICGDHPFFSVDDWFIGSTSIYGGIPETVRNLTVKFRYNDIESVQDLLTRYPGQIAGFVLEPVRTEEPTGNFLHKLQDLARKDGALFILDEMICGFRIHRYGGQHLYGIEPDLSAWGKALANGFSVSALVGKRRFMRLGDLTQTDHPRVFLLSTTHGGETHGLAAAIATMDIYRNEPVLEHMARAGRRLMDGVSEAARRRGIADHLFVTGHPANAVFATLDRNLRPSQSFRTVLMQETIRRGVIAPSLVVSYAHRDEDIDRTIEVFSAAMEVYARALEDGPEKYLVGPPSSPVYRTYNVPGS
jgi:glutamate-1-semialdehyde 2,1-aminomutase